MIGKAENSSAQLCAHSIVRVIHTLTNADTTKAAETRKGEGLAGIL